MTLRNYHLILGAALSLAWFTHEYLRADSDHNELSTAGRIAGVGLISYEKGLGGIVQVRYMFQTDGGRQITHAAKTGESKDYYWNLAVIYSENNPDLWEELPTFQRYSRTYSFFFHLALCAPAGAVILGTISWALHTMLRARNRQEPGNFLRRWSQELAERG